MKKCYVLMLGRYVLMLHKSAKEGLPYNTFPISMPIHLKLKIVCKDRLVSLNSACLLYNSYELGIISETNLIKS